MEFFDTKKGVEQHIEMAEGYEGIDVIKIYKIACLKIQRFWSLEWVRVKTLTF